jgi:DNA-binding NarL/FixJ family response regulator
MKQGRVVLADSHQYMLEGIRGLLETLFETVVMVADAESLCEAIRRLEPNLVIVDLSLPTSGKGNIVQQMQSRFTGLKVIVLSVHDEPGVADEVMHAGAMGFVLKRSAGTDLLPAVESVLAGETFISPGRDR